MYNNIDAMIEERLRRDKIVIQKRKLLKNSLLIFTKENLKKYQMIIGNFTHLTQCHYF